MDCGDKFNLEIEVHVYNMLKTCKIVQDSNNVTVVIVISPFKLCNAFMNDKRFSRMLNLNFKLSTLYYVKNCKKKKKISWHTSQLNLFLKKKVFIRWLLEQEKI